MIRKIILRGIIVAGVFFLTWFALAQFNWVDLLKIESNRKKLEEKLGKEFLDTFRHAENEVKNSRITTIIDSLLSEICSRNDLHTGPVKVYLIRNDDVNAFALPGNQILLFTGLIDAADSPEELCGVLCHELAHIEKGHVMKKLVKEVGLNALISMATSGAGPELLQKTAGLISSTAYDRNLESEADSRAVELLYGAGINPAPFAVFLTRAVGEKEDDPASIPWISTHPDPDQRAEVILRLIGDDNEDYPSPLQDQDWKEIKNANNI